MQSYKEFLNEAKSLNTSQKIYSIENFLDAIGTQRFQDFYKGDFDDYITGEPEADDDESIRDKLASITR